MEEEKRKQRKMRRYVYILAGAYITYQAVSMGMDLHGGVAADQPALIVGAAVALAAAGLAIMIWQVKKLLAEQKEEQKETETESQEEKRGRDS